MELVTDLATFAAPAAGTAVTIGAYDGVHLGHLFVVERLRDLAARRGLASLVVTFDRHPASVVRPESAPKLLTDLDQKLEVLAATGVDYVVVVPFDRERSQEEPEAFVRDTLVDALAARVVVVGEDFHFGRRRRGNVALLREMGDALGFEVADVALMAAGSDAEPGHAGQPRRSGHAGQPLRSGHAGQPVSSTAVRTLLQAGEVAGAAALLGRPHQVRGPVERGDQRGRALGFPTANVAVPAEVLLPAPGIYAGWYERAATGGRHAAAISVGRRPTFHPDRAAPVVLEAYLLDFDDELYGEEARVSFVARLRDEERYDSVDALVDQMTLDVAATREAVLAPVRIRPGADRAT